MASLEIGLIGTIALFAAILMGVNVMVALGAVGALGLTSVVGFHAATSMLSTVFFETTHSFHFSVIPLFLLMGYFAMRAGLGEDLFDAAHKWFGRLPGGLAISTTLGAAAFGAASGSSIGTATVFTKLALPQMLDRGYDKRLASASIAIAGTLAVMIPPSAVMVIFGILTDSSIGALLIAGVIPGFVFAARAVRRHPDHRVPPSRICPALDGDIHAAGEALFAAPGRAADPGDRQHHLRSLSRRVHADRSRRRGRGGDAGAGADPPAQPGQARAVGDPARDGEDLGHDLRHHHLRADLLALPGAVRRRQYAGRFPHHAEHQPLGHRADHRGDLPGLRHDDGRAGAARHHAADHPSGDDEARLRSGVVRRVRGAAWWRSAR